ncbi:DASH complex, subunit Dam1 [Rhodotorula toruloides]|uniref:DASH complex subunit DAM1 n=1 Tax=Rhodotorula toruloides TaxID=5286 RepID=A0A511KI95_RHOTO|nr:DASH complex, subunit Dam1 [Rhodotorula toruloides]
MTTPAAAHSQPRSRASSLARSASGRPTTPLRRISTTSLRALSLSQSRSNNPSYTAQPLSHLSAVFSELADAVSDLTANFEELESVQKRLDGVNESFAGWLLGLRANGYTVDFLEAPTKLNFDLAAERAALRYERDQAQAQLLHEQQQEQLLAEQEHQRLHQADLDAGGAGEQTFMTNDEDQSFVSHHPGHAEGTRGGTRGRGSVNAKGGRGGAAGARGGKAPAMTKKRKEEMAAFADPILPLLPIDVREKRRNETERVLWILRERGQSGGSMQDLVAHLSSGGPSQAVPQVRINEVLLALVRAKVVIKGPVKGLTSYRLEPNKCPS